MFFRDLGLREPDLFMGVRGAGFADQIGQILAKCEELFRAESPDTVLILGDTNTGLAAFVAKRMGIRVCHMEAGNRCFDDRVPEEVNRRVIDHSSTVLMPYTYRSAENLVREGIERRRIYVTGNPIKEVLDHYAPQIDAADPFTAFGVEPGKYFLVTAHRAETVDDPERLASLIEALNQTIEKYDMPMLASLHPRTADKMRQFGVEAGKIGFVPPLGLFDFVRLEKEAFCVLSDSGTVQEECCIFGVPTVTMRDVTERPETIECGSNLLAGVEAERILPAIDLAVALRRHVDPAGRVPRRERLRRRRQDRPGHRVSAPRILVDRRQRDAGPRGHPRAGPGLRGLGCVPRSRSAARTWACPPSECSAVSTPPTARSAYALVGRVKPDLVLNAVGIVKQRADAKAAIPSIAVNSLWPHVLADACAASRRPHGAREHRLRVQRRARRLHRERRARRLRPLRPLEAAGRGHRPRQRRHAAHVHRRLAARRTHRAGGLVRRAPQRAAQGFHEGRLQRA